MPIRQGHEEVKVAVKAVKNGNSLDKDNIHGEILKSDDDKVIEVG